MTTDDSTPGRVPNPDLPDTPDEPVPDVTPAEPGTPTVPDVPPGPDIPDVPPIDPEPSPEPGPTGTSAPTVEEVTGYTEAGVPTFDAVRERIEHRAATALGAEELARAAGSGRTLEEQYEQRQAAAADRLAEIRRSVQAEQDEPGQNHPG